MSTTRRDFIRSSAVATAAAAAGLPLPGGGSNVVTEGDLTSLKWSKAPCRYCGTGCGVNVAVRDGRVLAAGETKEVMAYKGRATRMIELGGRTAIPGLNDSHLHVIRGGLHYNLELRWDGVRSLADAMAMLADQVARTPAPQWVRVVGGFTEHQFAEKRLPSGRL